MKEEYECSPKEGQYSHNNHNFVKEKKSIAIIVIISAAAVDQGHDGEGGVGKTEEDHDIVDIQGSSLKTNWLSIWFLHVDNLVAKVGEDHPY